MTRTMKKPDCTPKRPRDIIDEVEDLCAEKGSLAEVSPAYYEAFLALTDAEMEVLAYAVLNAQAKEARRLALKEPAAEASARLVRFVSNTLSIIAMGIERFNQFAKLGMYKRVGPEPDPEVNDDLDKKVADARPIIELAVHHFIRRHHESGPETSYWSSRVEARLV
jgi:hypothetical protein